ncbi:hypothetical protein C8F01DRAFT_1130940 [Mycena amicta]|nr:hypothetical protein C8F01DRAFT_1130940 [Mycena amicta]
MLLHSRVANSNARSNACITTSDITLEHLFMVCFKAPLPLSDDTDRIHCIATRYRCPFKPSHRPLGYTDMPVVAPPGPLQSPSFRKVRATNNNAVEIADLLSQFSGFPFPCPVFLSTSGRPMLACLYRIRIARLFYPAVQAVSQLSRILSSRVQWKRIASRSKFWIQYPLWRRYLVPFVPLDCPRRLRRGDLNQAIVRPLATGHSPESLIGTGTAPRLYSPSAAVDRRDVLLIPPFPAVGRSENAAWPRAKSKRCTGTFSLAFMHKFLEDCLERKQNLSTMK